MLCSVIKVDMVYEDPDGNLMPFFDTTDTSPLMHSAELREHIRTGNAERSVPYLYESDNGCYYAGLKADEGMMYMGPMCSRRLSVADVRKMYSSAGITSRDYRTYPVLPLMDIRNMVLLTNTVLENANLENEELLQLNRIIIDGQSQAMRDKTAVQLRENDLFDENPYKHTYQEETLVANAVMRGDSDEAIRISESMDRDSGRLSVNEIQHFRSNAIIAITVCSRAAISADVSPSDAYRVSGYYINKVNSSQDLAHILHYRNRLIEEVCSLVIEQQNKQRSSGYVERCKNYVNQNYRYKIYIEEIASSMGISTSYLSRLFHNETGIKLQDYINTVRVDHASRLLMYSDMSLSEIAEYVSFPNQSYFGKIFRKYKGMTPKAYRDTYGIHDSV